MELPSLRQVLTGLLCDIEVNKDNAQNILFPEPSSTAQIPSLTTQSLPAKAEKALVALHQLYPHILLSSLDLLDHGLVTRFVLARDFHNPLDINAPIYYVRSSQTRSSRHGTSALRSVYEVRSRIWHCTCPSFMFLAYSSRQAFNPFEQEEDDDKGLDRWGGEMKGEQPAICKHLLAVVIGERLGVIPTKEADMDTLANYALGDA